MSYILGIDTAGPEGSIALARNGRMAWMQALPPGGHSGGLSEAVGDLLDDVGIELRSVEAFAVNEGPGSFTGLRIGLAWAKGAALGSGRPLVLVRAHEAMGRTHATKAERIVTAIPGARGSLEACLWEGLDEAWGPEIFEEGDLIPTLIERGTVQGLAIVPLTPKLAASLAEEAKEEGIAMLEHQPMAGAVAEIGARLLQERGPVDLANAAPAYGREPNARKPGS